MLGDRVEDALRARIDDATCGAPSRLRLRCAMRLSRAARDCALESASR